MMKKIFCTTIILSLLLLNLTSCGSNNDTEPPVITAKKTTFEIEANSMFDILDYSDYINISDNKDGKIDVGELKTDSKINTSKIGEQKIDFYVQDKAGNIGNITLTFIVKKVYSDEEKTMYDKILRARNSLKNKLKDPSSLSIRGIRVQGDMICFYYSAKNGFGGTVSDYAQCYNSVVLKASGAQSSYLGKAVSWSDVVEYSKSK